MNRIARITVLILLTGCFILSSPSEQAAVTSTGWKRRIIIDPGHGGYHKGGVGRLNGREVYEKDVTILLAAKLEKLLQADPRFQVQLTRRQDVYVGLLERTKAASQMGGDLFISLHCNAVPSSSRGSQARGFEIWTWNRLGNNTAAGKALSRIENEDPGSRNSANGDILNQMMTDALESHALKSRRVAKAVHDALVTHPYFRSNDRGTDSARFKVLEVYDMPSILIELGFMTHPDEVRMLFDSSWQSRYAQLIYQGIVRYYQTNDPQFPPSSQPSTQIGRANPPAADNSPKTIVRANGGK